LVWGDAVGRLVPCDDEDEVEEDDDESEKPGLTVRQSSPDSRSPSLPLARSRVEVSLRAGVDTAAAGVALALADALWLSCQAITPPSATAERALRTAVTRRARRARGRRRGLEAELGVGVAAMGAPSRGSSTRRYGRRPNGA
jgi:hypothetical protein